MSGVQPYLPPYGGLHNAEKGDLSQQEVIHDHDLKITPSQQHNHLTQLTPEELVVEKKLRRKIDSLIMPLVCCCETYASLTELTLRYN